MDSNLYEHRIYPNARYQAGTLRLRWLLILMQDVSLGISIGHTVIEIGSGTGTFAIEAALAGAKVYALDVSDAMLSYARQKAVAANAANIEFYHAGFLTYEHTANLADFIVTKTAFYEGFRAKVQKFFLAFLAFLAAWRLMYPLSLNDQ